MASAGASTSGSTAADAWKSSGNPLDHVSIVSRGTHNFNYKCNWCDHAFSGTKTRCYVHLTGDGKGVIKCTSITAAAQRAIKAAKAQDKGKAASKRKADDDLQDDRRSSHYGAGAGPSGAAAAGGLADTPVIGREVLGTALGSAQQGTYWLEFGHVLVPLSSVLRTTYCVLRIGRIAY